MVPLLRVIALVAVYCLLGAGYGQAADYKRQRLELASTFHPADALFGSQLRQLLAIVKDSDTKLRVRRSRKTLGFSPSQAVQLLSIGSIDGVLLDPVGLGYRPAMAQLFGGIPFGPDATRIVEWSESLAGREHISSAFQGIGAHPLLCGSSDSVSGVFSRGDFSWPVSTRALTVHSKGLANEVYQHLNIVPRPLPAGDLYMGYASGVVDLLVTLNPSIDARVGFGQVSAYFYYPSWERTSAFALLLMGQKKWQSLSVADRTTIIDACKVLNRQPKSLDVAAMLANIAEQGSTDTTVKPWPLEFLEVARQRWSESAIRVVDRHPSLVPVFDAFEVIDAKTESGK